VTFFSGATLERAGGGVSRAGRGLSRFGKILSRSVRFMLPRGMLGRSLLMILVPLVVVQLVALQIFYGAHLDVISRRLAAGVAGEVAMLSELMLREPDERRGWIAREAAWRLDMVMAFQPGARMQVVRRPESMPLLPLEEDLDHALEERMSLPFDTDWLGEPRSVVIRVQLPDGVLMAEVPRKRLFTATIYLFVIWLVGSALLLAAVSVVFLRNQVRAIRRLAGAAEAFGLGRDVGSIKPEGATEIRQAAVAFNRMQDRVRRFVSQRTEMLAGISHDLRTPMTRLNLGLAMLPRQPETEEDIAALNQDLAEMERLIAAYLSFARGEGTEQVQPADLVELVRDVAGKARRAGGVVDLTTPDTLTLPLRRDAIRRCLGNLLDNARRHASRVALTVEYLHRNAPETDGRAAGWAVVSVDDDGPGIPVAQREQAFRAFATSRADGSGLGLAIARDIVRAHGGDIVLEDSPLGGLRARLRLPV
jgi:two-component system osmolarity sensor histidine kinase EnvZ